MQIWWLLLTLALGADTYVDRVPDRATFDALSREVQGVELGKFVWDLRSDTVLFFDVKTYPLHLDFVSQVLWKRQPSSEDKQYYYQNYQEKKPEFVLGYITYQQASGQWAFSFWENDRIVPDQIEEVAAKLDATFAVAKLPWRPDSNLQEKRATEVEGVEVVTNGALYRSAPFIALAEGVAVGRLEIVPEGTDPLGLEVARDQVVVLQQAFPDLSPVAGILHTVDSTPLAHVNLRARSWRIPNATTRRGLADEVKALDGQWVYYEVRPDGYALRAATAAEQAAAQREHVREVRVPPADLQPTELKRLHRLRRRDASSYGAKAANLGEAAGRLFDVKVPPGFGIPVSRYQAHLETNGLAQRVSGLVADPRMGKEPHYRKQQLAELRQAIRDAPMDPALLDDVMEQIDRYGGAGVFVRSSTNAEDLNGFNGAGLYDTVPNVRGRDNIEAAIKQVWASLWNDVAWEERTLFGIDQRQVYAAVLVQLAVPATAAGVLVTKNLYDPEDDHTYTLNAKFGLGMRVVDGHRVPEQVLYDVKYTGSRIISRSDETTMLVYDAKGGVREVDVAPGEPVLHDRNARAISLAAQSLVRLFGSDQALDVEWVLEGSKVWIVQVRPFVE